MASGGRFHHIFTRLKGRWMGGVIGVSATCLYCVWYDSRKTIHAEQVLPDFREYVDASHQSVFRKRIPIANNVTVNEKYRKVAPELLKIIHQSKELCGSPGISFAISHDGETVVKGGIGLSDVENYTLMTSQTLLRIASISKSLTSVAVGKLLEEGALDLEVPVQTYFPKFPLKQFNGEDVNITLKQILSHTSGIRGYFDGKQNKGDEHKPLTDDKALRKHEIELKKYGEDCNNSNENFIKDHYNTVEEGLSLFQDDPLIYQPGEDYEYSSLAYSVISHVIELVSGKDYPSYMKKVCKDIGMGLTRVDMNDPISYNRSMNYDRKKDHKLLNVPYVDNSYKWSGGGFLSNVEDLLKFGNCMLLSSQTDQGYLKKSTVATLWHPESITFGKYIKDNTDRGYALGWTIQKKVQDEHYCISHSGGAVGVTSILMIIPTEGYMCSNTHPKGTVIALIANMQSAPGLRDASLRMNRCLQEYLETTCEK